LSSVEPKITLGLGKAETIDLLTVIWSDGKYQTIKNVRTNQQISLAYQNSKGHYYNDVEHKILASTLSNSKPLINFKHKDQSSIEFSRDPLIPFATTNKGPSISVADINNDELDDLFISGGKTQASQLFIQSETGSFKLSQEKVFDASSINEDVSHTFFDANNDGFKDLLVVSGGNEFRSGSPLKPRLYINKKGV